MIIYSSDIEPYNVEDYDITFQNGLTMPITVNAKVGDTVDFDTSPLTTIFHIKEQPSAMDPKLIIPSEDITIFMSHVIAIHHRTRQVIPPTPEQRDEFQRTIHELATTIQ